MMMVIMMLMMSVRTMMMVMLMMMVVMMMLVMLMMAMVMTEPIHSADKNKQQCFLVAFANPPAKLTLLATLVEREVLKLTTC